jgi:hypothetical protein
MVGEHGSPAARRGRRREELVIGHGVIVARLHLLGRVGSDDREAESAVGQRLASKEPVKSDETSACARSTASY